jgi:hypothetical protein
MAIHHELCETCCYFEPLPRARCVRYPEVQEKQHDSWCGEHKRDEARICYAEGAVIEPSRTMVLIRETFELTRKMEGHSPLPPRKPIREECLRAKGHEGKHANYRQEWE